MAVYNAEPWLDEAIRSVRQQTMQGLQLVCIDDASTDRSADIIRRHASEDPRLTTIFLDTNVGSAEARNRGLAQAKGDYIVMLDADDRLSPDALQLATEALDADPSVGCACLRLIREWPDHSEEHSTPLQPGQSRSGEEACRLARERALPALYVVRRDLHLRYPYATTCRIYSDDNTTRLHYLHSPKVTMTEGCYYWRQHPNSQTHALSPARFQHLWANLSMSQTLEKEGVSPDIRKLYDGIRWCNFRALLRLYFANRRRWPQESARLWHDFRTLYRTFPRLMPWPLYALREWVAYRISRAHDN